MTASTMPHAIAAVQDLQAYYITHAYGVRRTVKAVDGVSIRIRPNEIFGIAGESGCGKSTLVVVTHDMCVHANLCDRVAVLYAGKVIEEAGTRAIFGDPRHPYTQYLIRSLPKMDDKSERVSIPGRPPALDNPPESCRFHPRCLHAMPICREAAPPIRIVDPDHRVACYLAPGEDEN